MSKTKQTLKEAIESGYQFISYDEYGVKIRKSDGTEYITWPAKGTCSCPAGSNHILCKHLVWAGEWLGNQIQEANEDELEKIISDVYGDAVPTRESPPQNLVRTFLKLSEESNGLDGEKEEMLEALKYMPEMSGKAIVLDNQVFVFGPEGSLQIFELVQIKDEERRDSLSALLGR